MKRITLTAGCVQALELFAGKGFWLEKWAREVKIKCIAGHTISSCYWKAASSHPVLQRDTITVPDTAVSCFHRWKLCHTVLYSTALHTVPKWMSGGGSGIKWSRSRKEGPFHFAGHRQVPRPCRGKTFGGGETNAGVAWWGRCASQHVCSGKVCWILNMC